MIMKGEKIQTAVTVKNTGQDDVTIGLLPTCTCLTVTPAERTLRPGGEGTFLIAYDSTDDTGITRKDFIVQTRQPGVAPPYYTIRGVVRAERRASLTGSLSTGSGAGPAADAPVRVTYYYTPGLQKLRAVPCNRDTEAVAGARSFDHRGAQGRPAAGALRGACRFPLPPAERPFMRSPPWRSGTSSCKATRTSAGTLPARWRRSEKRRQPRRALRPRWCGLHCRRCSLREAWRRCPSPSPG